MAIEVNGSLAGVWAEPGNICVNICKVIGCKQKFLLLLSNFDLSDCINYRIRKWMCVILNILGETCHGGLSEVVSGAAAVYTCTLLWFYSCLVSSLGADLSTVLFSHVVESWKSTKTRNLCYRGCVFLYSSVVSGEFWALTPVGLCDQMNANALFRIQYDFVFSLL